MSAHVTVPTITPTGASDAMPCIADLNDRRMVTSTLLSELTCASQCRGHTHASQHSVASPTPPSSLVPAS